MHVLTLWSFSSWIFYTFIHFHFKAYLVICIDRPRDPLQSFKLDIIHFQWRINWWWIDQSHYTVDLIIREVCALCNVHSWDCDDKSRCQVSVQSQLTQTPTKQQQKTNQVTAHTNTKSNKRSSQDLNSGRLPQCNGMSTDFQMMRWWLEMSAGWWKERYIVQQRMYNFILWAEISRNEWASRLVQKFHLVGVPQTKKW